MSNSGFGRNPRLRYSHFHELGSRPCHDITVLTNLAVQLEKRRKGFYQPGNDDGGAAHEYWFEKPNIQLSRQSCSLVREETVRHGAVQKGGDDTAVQVTGVPLVQPVARKRGLHVSVGMRAERKLEPLRVISATQKTLCVEARLKRLETGFAFSGHTHLSRTPALPQDTEMRVPQDRRTPRQPRP